LNIIIVIENIDTQPTYIYESKMNQCRVRLCKPISMLRVRAFLLNTLYRI